MNLEIIIAITSLILGFLGGYITSYLNEKGKNLALKEDIRKLTEEQEIVKAKYALQTSKQKYLYEDKRTMYYKYFNLLDELDSDGLKISQEETLPAINNYTQAYLAANDNTTKILKAASDLSVTINNSLMKMNQSQMRLKNETKSIRLAAGERVLKALQDLEIAYDEQLERSATMMKDFAKNVSSKRFDVLQQQKEEIEVIGKNFMQLKNNLISEMRNELNEI